MRPFAAGVDKNQQAPGRLKLRRYEAMLLLAVPAGLSVAALLWLVGLHLWWVLALLMVVAGQAALMSVVIRVVGVVSPLDLDRGELAKTILVEVILTREGWRAAWRSATGRS